MDFDLHQKQSEDPYSPTSSKLLINHSNMQTTMITQAPILEEDKSDDLQKPILQVKLYPSRFWMLFVYSLCTLINACGWISFAPLNEVLTRSYGVSVFIINYMSLIYMIAYVPMNFPSVVALDKYGLRIGIAIGIILTTFGLWLRCLINQDFVYPIIGQTIMAIGQPFLYNAPAKLSGNWFGDKEKIYSTSIGAYANVLGVGIGYFVPNMFMDAADDFNHDDAKQHVFNMNLFFAILSSVICALTLLTFRNKPPSPPAFSQALEDEHANVSIKKDVIELLKNKGYLYSAIGNSLLFSYFFAFTTVIGLLMDIYSFSPSIQSSIGASFQFAGMFGGVVVSIILTRHPFYKQVAIVLAFFTFITLITVYFALKSQSLLFLSTAVLLNGFFSLSIFSVAFELAVEQTFPIGEATSGGIINTLANLFGFIIVMILTVILNNPEKDDVGVCCIILSGTLIGGFIFVAMAKIERKRSNLEAKIRRDTLQKIDYETLLDEDRQIIASN